MAIIASTGLDRNFIGCLRRVMDSAWWGKNVTTRDVPPVCLNGEYITGVNAAGTDVVNMIGVNSSNQVVLNGGTVVTVGTGNLPVQLGSTATAALALGGGTSTTPLTTATANTNFIGFWGSSTDATGGTTRLAYLRLYLNGAGLNGEAIRAFTTVNGVAAGTGGIHGIMSTASLDATATIGASVFMGGVRGEIQIDAASRSINGGVYAALMACSNIGTGNTLTGSRCSFIRVQNDGAVGVPNLFDIQGAVTRKGSGASSSDGLAILLDGVTKYIMIGT